MNFGSLFSGIGGLDLGLERAGMRCSWQVESDAYAQRVLEKHWPDVPRFRDIRDIRGEELPPVDLICGGFPCQDLSVAGKGAGIQGKRSGLWREFARLVEEIRPAWVLIENVPALRTRGLRVVLGDLWASGYDAEWDGLPASAFGAPHRRDRLFVVAYSNRQGQLQPRRHIFEGRGWASDSGSTSNAWTVEPDVGRVATRVPSRVDRLRCLGNAVVPQVAEYVGRLIMEAVEDARE